MSDHDLAERGRQAQAVLESPVYSESYALLASEFTQAWRDSRDPAEREQIHQLLLMLDKVKCVMEGAMRAGKIADAEINRKQTLMERIGLRRVS
jgi:hypothetical protein